MEIKDYAPLFTSLISFILAIAGWLIVYKNSNRLAKRSEAFNLTGKIIDKIIALDKRCSDYWLSEPADRESSKTWIIGTTSEVYGIRVLLDLLGSHLNITDKSKILYELRSAATLDAEEPEKLKSSQLRKKRNDQSAAFGSSIQKIYKSFSDTHL